MCALTHPAKFDTLEFLGVFGDVTDMATGHNLMSTATYLTRFIVWLNVRVTCLNNVQCSYASLCCSTPFPFPPIHLWLSKLDSWKTYLDIGTIREILDWCFTSWMMFQVFEGLHWVRLYWTVMYSHAQEGELYTCLCWGSTPGYTYPPSV